MPKQWILICLLTIILSSCQKSKINLSEDLVGTWTIMSASGQAHHANPSSPFSSIATIYTGDKITLKANSKVDYQDKDGIHLTGSWSSSCVDVSEPLPDSATALEQIIHSSNKEYEYFLRMNLIDGGGKTTAHRWKLAISTSVGHSFSASEDFGSSIVHHFYLERD